MSRAAVGQAASATDPGRGASVVGSLEQTAPTQRDNCWECHGVLPDLVMVVLSHSCLMAFALSNRMS